MTLYTALGRYEMKTNAADEKLPHVLVGRKDYELDPWEMILWSSLIWQIYTFDEVSKIFYQKERNAHILGDLPCESYLDRMEEKGLVACGHGVTGMDALHDLLTRLYVVPATANLLTRVGAFLHLTFGKGVPLTMTKRIFHKPRFNPLEQKLMRLSKQNQLSVGELVKCVECGVVDVSTNNKLMDALYDEVTDYMNIGSIWRGCEAHDPVLCSITDLYLGKHILFDAL